MELMASGLSPQMVWAFCKAVWQSLLCHWSRPSTPCSLGFEWEWINQTVWERSANLMHFVSRSTAIRDPRPPATCNVSTHELQPDWEVSYSSKTDCDLLCDHYFNIQGVVVFQQWGYSEMIPRTNSVYLNIESSIITKYCTFNKDIRDIMSVMGTVKHHKTSSSRFTLQTLELKVVLHWTVPF